MHFERPSGLGTGEDAWGQIPCSSKYRGPGLIEKVCWVKAWVLKPSKLKACLGVSMGTLHGSVHSELNP
jgi:hypothetical protein